MSEPQSDIMRLLAAHADFTATCRSALAEALKRSLAVPPVVTIVGTNGTRECRAEGPARAVSIRRSGFKDAGDGGGALVLAVNDRAIAPHHVRLELDGAKWHLRNLGDAPVRVDAEKLVIAPHSDPRTLS